MRIIRYYADKEKAEKMLEIWKRDYAAYPCMASFWIREDVQVINDKGETVSGYEVGVDYAPLD